MTQTITRLTFLLAATAISGCSFDPTGVSTGAIIEVACATDDECPAGFECEVEDEHGVTTSFCKAQDGSDECPAGFEVELEHGQVLCQPHGGDDGGAGAEPGDDDGGAGAEPGDDNGGAGAEPGDDDGGAGAEPGDDDGGAGAEPGDDDGGAGDDSADVGEDVMGDECAVDADCEAGSECEHGSCVPDVGHGGRDDGAQ